jgi:hypothetical protein
MEDRSTQTDTDTDTDRDRHNVRRAKTLNSIVVGKK